MGIKGISISRGFFPREKRERREKERPDAHAAMEASVSGRGGQDENVAFRPSRRLNSTAVIPRGCRAFRRYRAENWITNGHETNEADIPRGTFRGLWLRIYLRPRREIALRTSCCNTQIMREANGVKSTGGKKNLIGGRQKRRRRETDCQINGMDVEVIIQTLKSFIEYLTKVVSNHWKTANHRC